jgi:hypothetical protein
LYQFHKREKFQATANNANGFPKYALVAAEVISLHSSESSIGNSKYQPNDNDYEELVLDKVMLVKAHRGKASIHSILL